MEDKSKKVENKEETRRVFIGVDTTSAPKTTKDDPKSVARLVNIVKESNRIIEKHRNDSYAPA